MQIGPAFGWGNHDKKAKHPHHGHKAHGAHHAHGKHHHKTASFAGPHAPAADSFKKS